MFDLINLIAGVLILVVLIIVITLHSRINRNLDERYFQNKWNKLQRLCSNSKSWFQAIIDADDLLDEALKKRHFRGKTTGERMVSAQHFFSANDALWFSHKLTNKIKDNGITKLNKKETLEALASYRLALRDLGAIGAEREIKSRNGR